MTDRKENNYLIAEFLGWELQDNPTDRWYGSYREPNGILHKNTDKEPLLFHTSWDWLIPVVQKIEQVNEGVPSELWNVSLYSYHEEVYDAVVNFIKELNK